MNNFNKNKKDTILSRPLSKKSLIWMISILVILFILVLVILSSSNKTSQPSPAMPSTAEQLNQIDALRNQLTPTTQTTGAAPSNNVPANATSTTKVINKQIQTLNSLSQKATPQAPSPTQVQQQLQELNALRSK